MIALPKCTRYFLLFLLTVLPAGLFAQVDSSFHIYLMFGQSNMEGQGTIETQDRVTNPRVKVLQDLDCPNLGRTYGNWYPAAPPLNRCWSGLGIGDYFGKVLAAHTPDSITIGLVNASVSGCNIFIYKKGCPNGLDEISKGIPFDCGYSWLLDLAQKAQQTGVIKGIIFHQGETNNTDQSWKYTVQQIVSDLKTDLELGDIPFLAGELLYGEYNSCCRAHNVETNKLPGLIPNSHVISAAGLPGMDVAHFTSASYRTFGERYARKMLQLVYNNCDSTPLQAWYQLNSGNFLQADSMLVQQDSKVLLSPRPTNLLGSWSWSGAGTSGTKREQVVNPETQGTQTIISTYTNECGTQSHLVYKMVVCDSTVPEAWFRINEGEWTHEGSVNTYRGSTLVLSPRPEDGEGSWSWSGAGTSGTSREQTINTSSIKNTLAVAKYTNSCGATSRLAIPIHICDSIKIEPWIKAGNNLFVQTDSVSVKVGTTVKLSPYTSSSGTWNWSGAGLSGNSAEQFVSTDTAGIYCANVTFTNSCGFVSEENFKILVDAVDNADLEMAAEPAISVFPNPSCEGTFTISGIGKISQLELFDEVGIRVAAYRNPGQSSLTISLTGRPGLYLIRLSGGQGLYYKKICVQ
jgi:hypothetical protein